MSSPAHSYSADDDSASHHALGRRDCEGDRGQPASKRARISVSSQEHTGNTAGAQNSTGQQTEQQYRHERRALQACLRCRKQKLRCLGGRPCARCIKAGEVCNFDEGNGSSGDGLPNAAAGTEHSYQQERRAGQACFRCRKQKLRCLGGRPCARCVKASREQECDFGRPGDEPAALDPPALRSTSGPSHPPATTQNAGQVTFGDSPQVSYISPQSYTGPPGPLSPSEDFGTVGSGTHADNEKEAEERLASATSDGFEPPPFRALVYQPSVWENREASKRNSPIPNEQTAHHGRMPPWGLRDEPLTAGIVDLGTARILYTFFVDHCHPFLPIVDIAPSDPFASIQRFPSLFSAILAISARFYLRHSPTSQTLNFHVPAALADIAESHLAHTLLQKKHTLADVQAILLLAAWGLQSGGKGPDAWVLTGHAARVSRRLGIHSAVGKAVAATKLDAPISEDDPAARRQWRTWLAWFSFDSFLSFGFGRPQSTQFESIDDQAFLKARIPRALPRPGTPASSSLYGDAYIAASAQLAHVARSFVLWIEEQAPVGPPDSQSLLAMLSNLNARLDDWCKLWVSSGSSHALYLGASARIARLQAEHLRLSINAMALRSSAHDESSFTYLRKALDAATSTIQTHFESSQTDLAMSFATDYMTMAFAQAAVFLIRLTRASPAVQQAVALAPAAVSHYLTMSVDLLEVGDISETRLSTYFAWTIRGISRAAGLAIRTDDSASGDTTRQEGNEDQPYVHSEQSMPFAGDLGDAEVSSWAGYDHFGLNCMLGLSGGGGAAHDEDWLDLALGNLGQPAAPLWDMDYDANGQGLG